MRVCIFCILGCLFIVFTVQADTLSKLSFEQRVTYQRAIEEVYWSHTIWPRENPQRKPALQQVMSDWDIRSKVAEYLRNSDLLDSTWHHPTTERALQGEMDRMARESKDPKLLREIWRALGNDPYIIAECFARPILAERLIEQLRGLNRRPVHDFSDSSLEAQFFNYRLPEIKVFDSFDPTALQAAAPAPRSGHTAIWTGAVMIIWGGRNASRNFNTGSRYNPSANSWATTTRSGAPSARGFHTAVWTGTQMIIWGGLDSSGLLNTGGSYNPSTNSWAPTSTAGAPSARLSHTAVWTGTRMIIWGGTIDSSGEIFSNTGGRYNPLTNSWAPTARSGAPSSRTFHTAVWSGSQMIVWGGCTDFGCLTNLNTGGRYNPSTNSWLATSTTGAPSARASHTAVWTDSRMIIWGGCAQGQGCLPPFNTGGRYNPSTNSWTATTTTNAPAGRFGHTAVWTGDEMIIWGGSDGTVLNTGGRYNPSTNSWTATSTTNAPTPRSGDTAVWTGSQMIIWGGINNAGTVLNTGRRYNPAADSWIATKR